MGTSRDLGLRTPREVPVHALSIAVVAGALVLGLIALSKPVLAAAAAAVGLVGLAAVTVPDLATAAAVFIMYSNVAVVAVRFHGVPTAAGQGVAVLMILPMVHHLVVRRETIVVHPALPLMFLFLGIQLLGLAFSRNVEESTTAVVEYLLEGMLVFFLVTNAVRTPSAIRWATWSLLAAGVVMAAVPIYQQLTGSFDDTFGGFGQTSAGEGFRTGEVVGGGEVRQVRLAGTIGEQNRFAQNMLMLVPLGLLAAASQRSWLLKVLALGGAGAAGLGCALAFSRGAAVGFALTLAVMVAFRLVTLRQLAVVAVAVVLVLAAMPQYWTRLTSIQSATALLTDSAGEHAPDGAIRGRATEMIAAAQVYADHPLIGVGPGMFKYYSRAYGNRLGIRRLDEDRESHSLYLGIAADTGTLGITCFLAILGVVLHGLLRARARWLEESPELASTAAAYFAALVAYMATGLFAHMAYIRFFYLILGLAAAVTCIAARPREQVQ